MTDRHYRFPVGQVLRHRKGGEYIIVGHAMNKTDDRPCYLYRTNGGRDVASIYVRDRDEMEEKFRPKVLGP